MPHKENSWPASFKSGRNFRRSTERKWLARVAVRVPMPDYIDEQMPELMPKVMDNLMPHMIKDVVPLVTQLMIDYLKEGK